MANAGAGAPEAWVTLMTSDGFLMGVEALLSSLKAHTRQPRPVVVLVTPAVSPRVVAQVAALGALPLVVAPIPNPHAAASHVAGWVNSGFTKVRAPWFEGRTWEEGLSFILCGRG